MANGGSLGDVDTAFNQVVKIDNSSRKVQSVPVSFNGSTNPQPCLDL